jgi:hypothetical protein
LAVEVVAAAAQLSLHSMVVGVAQQAEPVALDGCH